MLGHVDHGKTTLTKALTGKWTDTHSEEIKRGISIRLGYADTDIYYCQKCKSHSNSKKCECGEKSELKRKISIVDAPGHETLMTAVLSASSILDGALFLVAANEQCPQPQTTEHMLVLNSTGIKNIVVVQTKIDLVTKEKAMENYKQIKTFLKGTVAENAPIIPISANYKLNIGALFDAIENCIPTPGRDPNEKLRMYISRSFDVNKPGTPVQKLTGGVFGGSVVKGTVKVGDKIEIKPGISIKGNAKYTPIVCEAVSLMEESEVLESAKPGGLVAVGTTLDPALTKSDALVGSIISHPNETSEAVETLKIKYESIQRHDLQMPPLREGDPIVINICTATTVGVLVKLAKKGMLEIRLKKPVVAEKGTRAAISRRVGQRWRLSGWGEVQ